MPRYIITNKAQEDLISIWNYTFDTWSENQADSYYNDIIRGFEEICDNPKIGRNYHNIEKDLFGYKVRLHIIFFRKLNNNLIEISRVLHKRMDLKNRIQE
jgi:toxin ParE1/3/4